MSNTAYSNVSNKPTSTKAGRCHAGTPYKSVFQFLVFFAMACVCTACKSPGELFPQMTPELLWPADNPRVRFVGQLKTSADLKPGRSFFSGLGRLILGPSPIHELRGPRAVVTIGNVVWTTDPGSGCIHGFNLDSRKYLKVENLGEEAGPWVGKLRFPSGLSRGPQNTFFCCDSATGMVFQLQGSSGKLIKSIQPKTPLSRVTAVAYSANTKSIYLLDTQQHDIKQLDLDGSLMRIIGKRGSASGMFNFPVDMICDRDRLWVVDSCNGRVQGLTLDGAPVAVIGQFGKQPGDFALPKGITADQAGRLYIVDSRFENVQIFDSSGRFLMNFGSEGRHSGEFSLPSGIFVDELNRIWVCDSYNHRLQLFQLINREATHE